MRRLRLKHSALLIVAVMLVVSAVPAGAVIEAEEAFFNTWQRTDKPVSDGVVNRTWMWGDGPVSPVMEEAYREHPSDFRQVQYWDKSRMEVNDPNADSTDPWYVTNGLLVKELMTGRMQFGDEYHQQYDPANIHIAGDASTETPTYATFGQLMDYGALPTGVTLTQTVNQDGVVGDEDALATYGVTADYYVAATDHNVASVFWEFMNSSGIVYTDENQYFEDQLFQDPFYATGLPVTEAYWTYIEVGGEPQWVLVQAFERRVLTYTPFNEEGWQVESGNVGRHYYTWRYGDPPPF